MGKAKLIGRMGNVIVPNSKADMRFRKKSYLRNKERAEACSYCRYKKGKVKVL